MADAPSTSSVKNRKTNYDFSDGFVKIKKRRYCSCSYCVVHDMIDNDKRVINWGLDQSVATRTCYKKQLQVEESLPIQIKSYLAGTAPSDGIKAHYTTHGHVVYLYSHHRTVHMYKSTIDTWYLLPDCPAQYVCAFIMIYGELTAIGGNSDNNKLYTLTGQGAKQQWTEEYPPMLQDQNKDTLLAICVGEALIVFTINAIKIMNTVSKQWSTAGASLLHSLHRYSGHLEFWRGGETRPFVEFHDSHLWVYYKSERAKYQCTKYHLDTLLSSCEPSIFEQVPLVQVSPTEFKIYPQGNRLRTSSNGRIIAENYRDDEDCCYSGLNLPSCMILKYSQTDESWETVGLIVKENQRGGQ